MRPNILYVFADQLSLQCLETYGGGNGIRTPHIDYLAQRGVKFTYSYCTTPQCSPSRSSMLTGLYPHKTKVIGNIGTKNSENLDPALPSLSSCMREAGYRTGYFGKWHLGGSVEDFGFDRFSSDSKLSRKQGDIDAASTEEALAFIREEKDAGPWCLVVSYNNPHDIYHVRHERENGLQLSTEHIFLPTNFGDDLLNKPQAQREFREEDQGRPLREFTEEDWKYYIAYYGYLVEKIDSELGRLMQQLKETGQEERTLVVFSSDHGDLMGSHRTPFKGPMMYDELVRVPLLFSWPAGGLPVNETRTQPAVNVDLLPTFCDFAGIEAPKGIDGFSLKKAILNASAPGRDYVVLEYYSKQKWINPMRTFVQGSFKYNLYTGGEEELYDLANDPSELHNLAGDAAAARQKSKLKEQLFAWMERERDPFLSYSRTDRSGNPVY